MKKKSKTYGFFTGYGSYVVVGTVEFPANPHKKKKEEKK